MKIAKSKKEKVIVAKMLKGIELTETEVNTALKNNWLDIIVKPSEEFKLNILKIAGR